MPRIGGGSRSGGGGSRHSSGGVSSSRHSSSSFSSRSRHSSSSHYGSSIHRPHHDHHMHYHHRPRHSSVFVFGGSGYSEGSSVPATPLYYSPEAKKLSNKRTAIFVLAIVLFFVAIMAFNVYSAICNPVFGVTKSGIERDYRFYHNMIATADDDCIVEGEITYIGKDSWSDKYYFEYVIPGTVSGMCEGYIYSVFTEEEIANFHEGQKIDVVVDFPLVTSNTDSVPVLFENYDWQDDGDIPAIDKWKSINKTFYTVDVVMLVSAIIIVIVLGVKVKKIEEDYLAKNPNAKEAYQQKMAQSSTTNSVPKCKYCGSVMSASDTSCKQCGASRLD